MEEKSLRNVVRISGDHPLRWDCESYLRRQMSRSWNLSLASSRKRSETLKSDSNSSECKAGDFAETGRTVGVSFLVQHEEALAGAHLLLLPCLDPLPHVDGGAALPQCAAGAAVSGGTDRHRLPA